MKYDIEKFRKFPSDEYYPVSEVLEALEETRRDLRAVVDATQPILHCLFEEIAYADVENLYGVVGDVSRKYTMSEEVPST